MKKILIINLFLIFCLQKGHSQSRIDSVNVDYAKPGTFILAGYDITGTNFLDKSIIKSLTGLVIGEEIEIPGEEISKAIRNLWKQGLFSDVSVYLTEVEGQNAYLTIQVTEKPKLSGFKYEARKLKKGDIEDYNKKLDALKGKPITESLKLNAKNILEDHFSEKKFLYPSIVITEEKDSLLPNGSFLNLKIDKGPKVKIDEITFEGIEIGDERKIRKAMKGTKAKTSVKFIKPEDKEIFTDKTKRRNFLYTIANLNWRSVRDFFSDRVRLSIFKASKFQEETYETDKRAVIEYYNSMGHRDATITFDTVYRSSNNGLKIEVKINEGKKYYFRNIDYRGNAKYSNEQLSKIVGIKKGDVYNAQLLQKKLSLDPNGTDVSTLYYDDGYLFFSINPTETAIVGDSIDLEIRINEGPQATIKNIIIVGNDKTNENVIRRELRTLPGNKFSRTDLIRSQREIANLGFFDAEKIEVNPIPHPEDGTVDIEYKVVEKSADQVELSAGWGGAQGLIGTLGLSFNNFSIKNMFKKGSWSPLPTGDGQKLSIRAQSNGKRYQTYNFSFTEPWLGGHKPNSFSVSAFSSRFQEINSDRTVTGKQITNGFSIGLGTRLKKPDDYFILQSSFNFQNYNLKNFKQFIGNNGEFISNGSFNNMNLKLSLSRNSIDQPIFPTSGANIELTGQFTPPYSVIKKRDYSEPIPADEKYQWIEYHKWRFNVDWYQSLGKKFVLRTAAKFGFLGTYNKKNGLSPFERYEVGGNGLPGNVQLFGTDIISHRGYNVYSPSGGAALFNKFTVELRYPFSLNPQASVWATAFYESGNSWNGFKEYNPFKLNRSVGMGIRAMLPMFGLLGVDYGVRFDSQPGSLITPAKGFFDYIGKNGEFTIILGFEPE
ncbi:MAG: BamA/TamA family outer membrane protein [Bacteroidetes bacterium]|nr:BamA/TamA family outer membrane protein [Bacteroidota bacterium]